MPKKKPEEIEDHEVEETKTEQKEEQERPEWLPQNFKNPEDLAKSYEESQRKITELSTAQRQQQEQFEEYIREQQASQQQTTQQTESQDLVARYESAMEEGDYRTALAIQNHLNNQTVVQAVQQLGQQYQQPVQQVANTQHQLVAVAADQQLTAKYQDWGEYKQRVADEVSRDPNLLPDVALNSPEQTARALERVYKTVKADVVLSKQEQDQSRQAELRREKQAAQTVPGLGSRERFAPADQAAEAWEAIKNADLGNFSTR